MIHAYKNNGYNIVLDVNSGAVHVVSDVVYALLKMDTIEKAKSAQEFYGRVDAPHDQVDEAFSEIKQLQEAGLLFSDDPFEAIAPHVKNSHVVKALCLHVAHDCNLRCEYCFADEGAYHEGRSLMSAQVARDAIDFVIQNSGSRKNIEIDFFGGEPLMNFDVVKDTVAYARGREEETGKKFRFTITTNGVLLTPDKIEYINENMDNCVLSLDGRRDVNDRVRRRKDGGSSYDLIVGRFQELAKTRTKDYYVRGTFTRYNLDFCDDVLHLVDLGFSSTSVEPVVAPADKPYAIREGDIPQICAEYDRLAKEYIRRRREGRPFTFFHFMVDLDGGPCVIKRLRGCGAGCEYLAVTPEGELYPCHQFVGNPEFLMGDVKNGIRRPEITQEFAAANVYAKEKCKTCWARFYCSGGCLANAHEYGGGLDQPYGIGCELLKKRLECAIMIKAALAGEQ